MSWREYIRALKQDPFALPYFVIGGRESLLSRALSHSLGSNQRGIRQEFSRTSGPLRQVFDEITNLPYLGWTSASEVLYVVVRALRPTTVIETGVAAGLSSACILAALEKNGHGSLHSIDLPNAEREYLPGLGVTPSALLPEGKAPGFLVPSTLRSRWTLHIGDTRKELPRLIRDLPDVDLFLHDSEHTYQAMTFEYETVWPHVSPGGLILSDEVSWNDAFPNFCQRQRLKPVYFWGTGLGGVRKPSQFERTTD
jgi:predicted O-methyltransferase YrrM